MDANALAEASGNSWISTAVHSPARNGSGVRHNPRPACHSHAATSSANSTRPGHPAFTSASK